MSTPDSDHGEALVYRRELRCGAAGLVFGVLAYLTASPVLGLFAVVATAVSFGIILTRV